MRTVLALLSLLLVAGCVERAPQTSGTGSATDSTAPSSPRSDSSSPVANDRVYDVKAATATLTNSLQPGIEQKLRFDNYGARVALESRQGDTTVVQISANGRDIMYNTVDHQGASRPIHGHSYFLKSFIPDLRTLDSATLASLEGSKLTSRTVAGQECPGYQLRYGGRTVSVWHWRGVPMRVEVEQKQGGKPLVIEVTKIEEEEEIPEVYFTVPPEVTVVPIEKSGAVSQ